MRALRLFTLAMLLLSYPVAGQDSMRIGFLLDSLKFVDQMPEEILQTKSIALVKVPARKSGTNIVRGDWKKLAEAAQPGFKKSGIDVVAYYYFEDIFSGKEPYLSFLKDFKEREIKNVVFLSRANGKYDIVLTKMALSGQLIAKGQEAWQTSNSDLAEAIDDLYKAAANDEQDRENLLILEIPEYGEMTHPITGRRGEYYDLNFSSEKLAVPIFADTAKLNLALSEYPYRYGLVDPELEEKELRAKGYQYVLYFVHSTGKAVKQILEYPTTETETVYISETIRNDEPHMQSYNVNTPVYKFYIKHIYSGNVFLGKKWDAAPTWEEALGNFIDNLRSELIRN